MKVLLRLPWLSPLILAITLIGAPVAHAFNCIDVILRDPYWGQFRAIVQSGWSAAGVGSAFARGGFVVNDVPEPGAIMVWPAGVAGASSAGHVGIVVAVYDQRTVLVRHENWPYGTAEHFQVFPVYPAERFVHPQGSAGSITMPIVASADAGNAAAQAPGAAPVAQAAGTGDGEAQCLVDGANSGTPFVGGMSGPS